MFIYAYLAYVMISETTHARMETVIWLMMMIMMMMMTAGTRYVKVKGKS